MPEIKTVMTADTSQFERAMKRSQSTANQSANKIQGGFSKVGSAFGSIASKAGAVGIAIGTISTAMAAFSGKNIDLARQSFDDLATSFNVSGDKMLAKLQMVSNGMISDFDLIQAASRAMVLGLQPDAIVSYLEIAAASSKATGQTMTQAFDDITIGVARQSRMILDNLGIIVSVEKANEKYARALGVTTDELTDNQKALAFQAAVMEAGQRQINILGSDTEKVMSESARLIAQVTNWWDKFANTMGKALNFVSGAINMFISESTKAYDFLFSKQNEAEKRFKIGKKGEALPVGYDMTTPLNGNGVQAVQDQAEISTKRAKEIEKMYDQINKTINKYTESGVKQEIDLINYKWDQEIKAAKGNSKLIKDINFARELEINAKNKELYDERKELLDQQRYELLDEKDAELADLQDWYDKVMELEGLTQEERLSAQQTFEERKRLIQLESLAKQLDQESEYEDKMRRIKEKETREKERHHKIQLQGILAFGQLALQYGGTVGEKLFKVSQGVAAAQAIVDTHAAVMKTMASVPYPFNIPLAAAQAAIGASEVASILSTSVGSTDVSSSVGGGGGGAGAPTTDVGGVTPTQPQAEETKGSYTINIMGDIMNEDYVDLLAEKISEAVQDRNVILKASQARTVRG